MLQAFLSVSQEKGVINIEDSQVESLLVAQSAGTLNLHLGSLSRRAYLLLSESVTLNLSMAPGTLETLSIYDMDSETFLKGNDPDHKVVYLQGLRYSVDKVTLK